MRRLDPSNRYLRWYRSAVSLFPLPFQKRFGEEMIQLFQDQLVDAEAEGIAPFHVAALAFKEIPAALVRQYVMSKGQDIPHATSLWKELRFMVIMLTMAVFIGFFGQGYGYNWGTVLVPWVFLAIPCFYAWHLFTYIRNLWVSILTTLAAIGVFAGVSTAFSSWGMIGIGLFTAFVAAYALQFVVRKWSRKYFRKLQALPTEVRETRVRRNRKIGRGIGWALAFLLLVPNIIGTYDPYPENLDTNIFNTWFDVPAVDNSMNSLYVLMRLPGDPEGIYRDPQKFPDWMQGLTYDTQDDSYSEKARQFRAAGIDSFLNRTETPRKIIAEASTLPAFQILPVPGWQTGIVSFDTDFPYNSMYAMRTVLLAAGWHADTGNRALAQAETAQVLSLVHQFSISGDPAATFIMWQFTGWMEGFAKAYPGLMADYNGFVPIASEQEMSESYKLVIRAESAQYIQPITTNGQVDSFFMPVPFMRFVPYLFQRNKTVQKANDVYLRDTRVVIQPCSETVSEHTFNGYESFGPASTIPIFFTMNGIGNAYVNSMAWANQGENERSYRCTIQSNLAQVSSILGLQSTQD